MLAVIKVNWSIGNLYFPAEKSSVMGYKLVTDGIPKLVISWDETHAPDYIMEELFSYSKNVPIEDFSAVLTRISK
jgi:hypothetical protein